MKVITGGIPGKPVETVDVGAVYNELSKVVPALAQQMIDTDRVTLAKLVPTQKAVTLAYGELNQRLDEHINTVGAVHGETVQSIGLNFINDYPNATPEEIVAGKEWRSYVTPRALSIAMDTVQPPRNELIVQNGLLDMTKGWILTETLNAVQPKGIYSNPTWTDLGVFYRSNGAGVVNPTNNPSYGHLTLSSTLTSSYIHRCNALGVVGYQPKAGGWNATSIWYKENDHRIHLVGDELLIGKRFHLGKGIADNNTMPTASAMWALPLPNLKTALGVVLRADNTGIHLGIGRDTLAVSGDTFTGTKDATFKWTLDGVAQPESIINIPWSSWTNGTVEFDHTESVEGGVEWIVDGKQLALVLLVNLKLNGKPLTFVFQWTAGFLNETTLAMKLSPFSIADNTFDALSEDHPFHPIYGAGVFKPNGGHVTGSGYGRATMMLEHLHDINSLSMLYTKRKELKDYPVRTEGRLSNARSYSVFGPNVGRLFQFADRTYTVGRYHADGTYSYFNSVLSVQGTKVGTDYRFKPAESVVGLIEYGYVPEQLVNVITKEGSVSLSGRVWSSLNDYVGKDEMYTKPNLGMYGKQLYLTEDSQERLEQLHDEFKGEMETTLADTLGDGIDVYTGLVVYEFKDVTVGLVVLVEQHGVLRVARATVSKVDDRNYRIDQIDPAIVVHNDVQPTLQITNGARFLIVDYYAYEIAANDYRLAIKHPFNNRSAVFDLQLRGTTLNVVRSSVLDIPRNGGLMGLEVVVPTLSGLFTPYNQLQSDHEYRDQLNHTCDLYQDLRAGPGWLMVDPDTQLIISGTRYEIPPGLTFWYTTGKTQYLLLGYEEGQLRAIVSDTLGIDMTNRIIYGEVSASGVFTPHIV